jgi:hypothetical protein
MILPSKDYRNDCELSLNACIFKRATISSSTHPQIAAALCNGLDQAVDELMRSSLPEDSTAPVRGSVDNTASQQRSHVQTIGVSNDIHYTKAASAAVASVSSLPVDLQQLVKEIQRRQQDLKASLHCIPPPVPAVGAQL